MSFAHKSKMFTSRKKHPTVKPARPKPTEKPQFDNLMTAWMAMTYTLLESGTTNIYLMQLSTGLLKAYPGAEIPSSAVQQP